MRSLTEAAPDSPASPSTRVSSPLPSIRSVTPRSRLPPDYSTGALSRQTTLSNLSSPAEPSLSPVGRGHASQRVVASLAGIAHDASAAPSSRPSSAMDSPGMRQPSEASANTAAKPRKAEDKESKKAATISQSTASTSRGTFSNSARARQTTDGSLNAPRTHHLSFPLLQDPKDAPEVHVAPATGMYWSKAFESGAPHPNLRAHTTTIIGSNIYIFGGCDARTCFNKLYILDADSFYWWAPQTVGEVPVPLRAMTCTAVGKKLIVFGGGDGPAYYNDVWVFDTLNLRWSRPRLVGDRAPCKRRAHTACLYKNGLYIFGGGDGDRALNDIWRLDVSDSSKMAWKLVSSTEKAAPGIADYRPKPRGYHTANVSGGKLIVFGGSDSIECFDDVWIYDIEKHTWIAVDIADSFRRLSHTATLVGSYLFVIGGHDGHDYCNDLLLLNLVSMTWDKRKTYGKPLSVRGYHGTVLHDSRLLVIGGFDGAQVFGDVTILELAIHAYYSQISHFTIDV
ncbi:hypothetical protein CDD81_1898 [Ophiocordyceps australis]|uniref:Uncharacterized protein n=1 Tax=Ophiocordyceps australis TaxID=1399860 RepID=A0A2C5XYR2_9HYPO|nr:hypothetical protein CDD81_1898 [Ophiocordyceps australis]